MKTNRLLPWVGWNAGNSIFLLPGEKICRLRQEKPVATKDPFVDVTKLWWEKCAEAGDWKTAARIGKVSAERRPDLPYGWENWAWALHKQGETGGAYKLLAPLLKQLKLSGPPSGRAAYCLACFCGTLHRVKEGTRWLRLAYALSVCKDEFRVQALLEPDLRSIWPGVAELNMEAVSVLE